MTTSAYFLSIDLGATSGRSFLATIRDGKLFMRELTRFSNSILSVGGKSYWNIYALYSEIIKALLEVKKQNLTLSSLAIDTWGVDFVYVGSDGSILGLPRAYRDSYTNGVPEELFTRVSARRVYDLTGIQVLNFNSLFQLYASKKESSSAFEKADKILFVSDALSYMLTGKMVCEYTIASTSQLLNSRTKCFERELLDLVGFSAEKFPSVVMPGSFIGELSDTIVQEVGMQSIPVIAVAGHDTASAIAAIPTRNERYAFLSSGTWSLMGIEVSEPIINDESFAHNFTNEGGVEGSIRFLKNITGMWLLEQCRKEWSRQGVAYSYEQIDQMMDEGAPFAFLIDPDDSVFANPLSMVEAIQNYCFERVGRAPETHGEIVRCIFESLALKYRSVLEVVRIFSPHPIERLHVIGGGVQNELLCQMTANSIALPVVAGPAEATAIGNAMMQAKTLGIVSSLAEMRQIISDTICPTIYLPQSIEVWDEAYRLFQQNCQ